MTFLFIHYIKYNTIVEHMSVHLEHTSVHLFKSTPVPTLDNRHIQIYIYMNSLCILYKMDGKTLSRTHLMSKLQNEIKISTEADQKLHSMQQTNTDIRITSTNAWPTATDIITTTNVLLLLKSETEQGQEHLC